MIDALLFAVRDGIRAQSFGYGSADLCEIMPDGKPPAGSGNIFVSVYETTSRSTARRNLDEYFSFAVTLTMKVTAPMGRIGDQQLASKLARTSTKGQPSFNARMEQLRAFLHMNWLRTVSMNQTPASANDNLGAWTPSGNVYGFIEPAAYRGRGIPELVGGDWFAADPTDVPVGLKCEMRFDDARRMQPMTAGVGPYG